jgi:SPP1 gp7 family putative phage head morphogenesis protein
MAVKSKYIIPRRKWKFPLSVMRDYQRTLRSIARVLHESTMSRIETIKSLLNARQDESDSEYIMRLVKEAYAATGATDKALQRAARIAEQVRGYNQGEFYNVLRSALKVDIFVQDPDLRNIMEEFTAENVRLIKSIPDQYFGQLQGIVSRGLTDGTLAKDMVADIQDLYGVTSRRAQLIARDQIGSLNGMITQKRQMSAGIGVYQWSGSLDERERKSHLDREGKYYAWPGSGMAGKVINGRKVLELINGRAPGLEINCRCVALPVIDIEAMQGGIRL